MNCNHFRAFVFHIYSQKVAFAFVILLLSFACSASEDFKELWDKRISQHLPIGSKKGQVKEYLETHSLILNDGIARPLPGGQERDRVYKLSSAPIDVPDTWTHRNSKLLLEFYFDEDGRLAYYRAHETYASW